MIELSLTLIPFLIVDALNPVLFALLVFAVGSSKPFANSIAFLSGHTTAYFFSGVIIAFGLEKITARLSNPLPVDFVIGLVIGLLCLWAALKSRDGNASAEKNPEGELTPTYCFGYGMIVNFIGVPFALPYFAAIDQILSAGLPLNSSLFVLAGYNAAYALPFILVPVAVALIGDRSKPILDKINAALVSLTDKLMPIMLFLIGAALTIDALKYFATGESLW